MMHPHFLRAFRARPVLRLAVRLAAILPPCVLATPALAGGGFGRPVPVNFAPDFDLGSDDTPRVAGDGSGRWIAVWSTSDTVGCTLGDDFDLLFAISTDDGASWGPSRVLNSNASDDTGGDVNPDIATDGAGAWLVVWTSNENLGGAIGSDFDLVAARSTDDGATWSAPAIVNLSATFDNAQDTAPAIAFGGGRWMVAWAYQDNNAVPFGADSDIFAASSTNGGATWSFPVPINDATGDAGGDVLPDLATDAAGNWLAVWSSTETLNNSIGLDEDILIARSTDDGATWSPPGPLNDTAFGDFFRDSDVVLATDRAGLWVATWLSNSPVLGVGIDPDLFVARSTDLGATWTSPAVLNGNAATDSGNDGPPTLATDAAGTWMAAWSVAHPLGSDFGDDLDILVATSTNGGVAWSPPAPLNANASYDKGSDSSPYLASAGGTWLAVWSENDAPEGALVVDNDVASARSEVATPFHDASVAEHDIPVVVLTDDLLPVTVSMANTGTSTWTDAGGFRLLATNDPCGVVPGGRVDLGAGDTLPTGAIHDFEVTLQVPGSVGLCALELRMETAPALAFGEPISLLLDVRPRVAMDAKITSDSLASRIVTDHDTTPWVLVRNTGFEPWSAAAGHHLKVVQDSCSLIPSGRIDLGPADTIPLHGEFRFDLPMHGPPNPGPCFFGVQMAKDAVGTFGQARSLPIAALPTSRLDLGLALAVDLPRAAEDSINDESPKIVSDGAGTWIVFWGSFDRMRLARSTDDGASWEPSIEFPQGGGDPWLANDGADGWVAVWRSSDPLGGMIGTDLDILFSRSTDEGATWTPAAAIADFATTDVRSDFTPRVEFANGAWIAAWTTTNNLAGNGTDQDIAFVRSTDGGATWSPAAPLPDTAVGDTGADDFPSLASDGAGNWLVAWEADNALGGTLGTDRDILFATSTDDGATWAPARALDPAATADAGTDVRPSAACDAAGRWMVAWRSDQALGGSLGPDTDIVASFSTDFGANWSAPMAVNAYAPHDDTRDDTDPTLATDGAGLWLASWASYDPSAAGGFAQDFDVFGAFSTNGGLAWSAPGATDPAAATDFGGDIRPSLANGGPGRWMSARQSFDFLLDTIGSDADILLSNAGDPLIAPVAWAEFFSSTVPFEIGTNQNLPAEVRLRNAGATVWSAATGERLGIVADACGLMVQPNSPVPAGETVAPGLFHSFDLALRGPSAGGFCPLHLRMQDGAGVPFGPVYAFNVTVVPNPARDALFLSDTLPNPLKKTAPVEVAFTILNSGQTAWSSSGGYEMRFSADTCSLFPASIPLPAGTTVAPGEQYVFTAVANPPDWAGFCSFQANMASASGSFGKTYSRFLGVDFGWLPTGVVNSSATTDIRLDNSPAIATDDGIWTVAWNTQQNLGGTIGEDFDLAFARSTDAGGSWSPVAVLNDSAGVDGSAADRNPVVAAGGGLWIAAWRSPFDLEGTHGTDPDVFFSTSADGAVTWSPMRALNINAEEDAGADVDPSVAIGPTGTILAAWPSNDSLGGTIGDDWDVLFARSDDGATTWTAPAPLHSNAATDTGDDARGPGATGAAPALVPGAPGVWIAAWDSRDDLAGTIGPDPDVLFVRSTDDGVTWSPPAPLNADAATDAGGDFAPRLATDGAGTWIAVWTACDSFGGALGADFDVLQARSIDDGLTWGAPVVVASFLANDVASDGLGDSPSGGTPGVDVATDRAGHWLIAWDSPVNPPFTSLGADLDLLYVRSSDDGLTWSSGEALNPLAATDSGGDVSPRIATDGAANWLVVWSSHEDVMGQIGSDRDILFTRAPVLPQPDDARFLFEDLPDQVPVGGVASGVIRMRDTGTKSWGTTAYSLARVSDPCGLFAGSGLPLGVPVAPGESFDFALTANVPTSPGVCAIEFRMFRNGGYFGDVARVEIEAMPLADNDATFVSNTIPGTMIEGDPSAATILVRNAGNRTWSAGANYRLAILDDPCGLFPGNRLDLPPATSVATGETHAFLSTLQAPATPQTCALRLRMVEEGVEFFGQTLDLAVQILPRPARDSAFVGSTFAATIPAGASRSGGFVFRNTGTETWSAAAGHELRVTLDTCDLIGPTTLAIPAGASVAQGQTVSIPATATAPAAPQLCAVEVRLRHAPSGQSFGALGHVEWTVTPATNMAREWLGYE